MEKITTLLKERINALAPLTEPVKDILQKRGYTDVKQGIVSILGAIGGTAVNHDGEVLAIAGLHGVGLLLVAHRLGDGNNVPIANAAFVYDDAAITERAAQLAPLFTLNRAMSMGDLDSLEDLLEVVLINEEPEVAEVIRAEVEAMMQAKPTQEQIDHMIARIDEAVINGDVEEVLSEMCETSGLYARRRIIDHYVALKEKIAQDLRDAE